MFTRLGFLLDLIDIESAGWPSKDFYSARKEILRRFGQEPLTQEAGLASELTEMMNEV